MYYVLSAPVMIMDARLFGDSTDWDRCILFKSIDSIRTGIDKTYTQKHIYRYVYVCMFVCMYVGRKRILNLCYASEVLKCSIVNNYYMKKGRTCRV